MTLRVATWPTTRISLPLLPGGQPASCAPQSPNAARPPWSSPEERPRPATSGGLERAVRLDRGGQHARRPPRLKRSKFGYPSALRSLTPGSADTAFSALAVIWSSLDSPVRNELFQGLARARQRKNIFAAPPSRKSSEPASNDGGWRRSCKSELAHQPISQGFRINRNHIFIQPKSSTRFDADAGRRRGKPPARRMKPKCQPSHGRRPAGPAFLSLGVAMKNARPERPGVLLFHEWRELLTSRPRSVCRASRHRPARPVPWSRRGRRARDSGLWPLRAWRGSPHRRKP